MVEPTQYSNKAGQNTKFDSNQVAKNANPDKSMIGKPTLKTSLLSRAGEYVRKHAIELGLSAVLFAGVAYTAVETNSLRNDYNSFKNRNVVSVENTTKRDGTDEKSFDLEKRILGINASLAKKINDNEETNKTRYLSIDANLKAISDTNASNYLNLEKVISDNDKSSVFLIKAFGADVTQLNGTVRELDKKVTDLAGKTNEIVNYTNDINLRLGNLEQGTVNSQDINKKIRVIQPITIDNKKLIDVKVEEKPIIASIDYGGNSAGAPRYIGAEAEIKDFKFKYNDARMDKKQNGILNSSVSPGGLVPTVQTDRDAFGIKDNSKSRLLRVEKGFDKFDVYGGYSSDSNETDETHLVNTNVTFPSNPLPPINLVNNTRTKTETQSRTSFLGGSYNLSDTEKIGTFSKYNVTDVKVDASLNGSSIINYNETLRTNSIGSFIESRNKEDTTWVRAMLVNNSGNDLSNSKKWEHSGSFAGTKFGGTFGNIGGEGYYGIVIPLGGDEQGRTSDIRDLLTARDELKLNSGGWLREQTNFKLCDSLANLKNKGTSFIYEGSGKNYVLGASTYLSNSLRLAAAYERDDSRRRLCIEPRITLAEKLSVAPYYMTGNDGRWIGLNVRVPLGGGAKRK